MRAAVMENKSIKKDEAKNLSFTHFVGVIGGLAGGFVLIFFGAILSAVSLFTRVKFHGWEVILFVAGFVFLVIGSHFLDLTDREKKERRKQKLNL